MNRALLLVVMLLGFTSMVYADGGHDHHAIPTMPSVGDTKLTIDDQTVTLTFGPVDLPTGHDGDLASSMPKKARHSFSMPLTVRRRYGVSFRREYSGRSSRRG